MIERPDREDSDLLREYVETRSEVAFAELVRRRIKLVYSVALRQTRGDTHRAEDATQAVFADLARKAVELSRRPVLVGWLYRSAEFAAAGMMRAERRRQQRDHEAHVMENMLGGSTPETDWDRIRPLLDRALNEMDETDRDAILLRFFDGRPFAEIGLRLRLTENTARMRVDRAVDKLHAALARRGITSTAVALGVALGQQAGATVPAGLAAAVAGAATAGVTAGVGGGVAIFMGMNTSQLGIVAAIAAVGTVGYLAQANENSRLRTEIGLVRQEQEQVAGLRADNQRLAATVDEVAALRRDDAEFAQLEQQVAEARRVNNERVRVAQQLDGERQAKIEVERMNKEGNALVDGFKRLSARSRDLSLSVAERAEAEASAKAQMEAIQAKQREIQAFIAAVRARIPGFTPVSAAANSMPIGDVLRLPQADVSAALSAFESVSGQKVLRDESVASVTARIDVAMNTANREEAVTKLRRELQQQLNIVLEPSADGNWVARKGSSQ